MTVHFKRRILRRIFLVETVLIIISMVICILTREENMVNIPTLLSIVLLITTLLGLYFFPDFDYCINVCNNSFIIHMSEENKYTFSKSFIVEKSKKSYAHIILKDENTSVSIPYNKKVLEFLDQIKK